MTLPFRKSLLNKKTYEPPAEGRAKKIRLDFNENTSGCSPKVLRALTRLTPRQLAMYPEYEIYVRRFAKHFRIKPAELVITNGGDDALRVFFDAFVDAGSSILICEPTFPMYRFYAEIYGAEIKVCRFSSAMEFPVAQIIDQLKEKPRVIFLANPNNPTGSILTPNQLTTILHAATDTAVVIDEAYSDFSGTSVVSWIRKFPQLFVAKTFSKATGLAALRLGAIIASASSLASLRGCVPPFPVNLAALVAADAALNDPKFVRDYLAENRRIREHFVKSLAALHIKTFPSSANFVLADFGPTGPAFFKKLERANILIRDRSRDIAPGFARITIGTAAEMRQLLTAIRKHFRAAKPPAPPIVGRP